MSATPRPVAAAFSLGAAAFFLLSGYEFARSVSTSLFIEVYGAHHLPWVLALSPVGTLMFVYVYSRLLSRFGSRRTLVATSLMSGAAMLACYALIIGDAPAAVFAFYVLRESYIVLIIEQYWSFIDSTLDAGQARRINGPLAGIGSLGGILGGVTVGLTAEHIGTEQLMLFAAASVVPAAALAQLAFRLGGEPRPGAADGDRGAATQAYLGMAMFRRHRVLFLLAFVMAASQVVAALLEIRLGILAEEAIPATDERTAFFGFLYAGMNGGALVLQFVVTPVLLRYVPLAIVHLAIPVVHMATCIALAVHPTLTLGAGAFLIFKCVDYSIFRAAKEILYMPLPFDARYRAKELIDAFGYRASKGGTSALLSAAGVIVERLPVITYAAVAFVAAALWLAFVVRLRPVLGDAQRDRNVN